MSEHSTVQPHSHDEHRHDEHPHVNYKKIYFILLGLFIVSVAGPEIFPHSKVLVLLSAFGIAIVKAIMVAGYFMHLAHEKKYIWYAFITSLGLLFLFFMAVAPDIMKHEGQNWKSKIIVNAEDGYPKQHGNVPGQSTGHNEATRYKGAHDNAAEVSQEPHSTPSKSQAN